MGVRSQTGGSYLFLQRKFGHLIREDSLMLANNSQRHAAENAGYFTSRKLSFLSESQKERKKSPNGELTFYDSVTGKPLFHAPRGRTWKEFVNESKRHGWPSFRDDEVNWEVVRCLRFGETVSLDGTHLGHNIPDRHGNRYCINLVSIAGRPIDESSAAK